MAGTKMPDEPSTPAPDDVPNPLDDAGGTLPPPAEPLPGPMPFFRRKRNQPKPPPLFPEAKINGRPVAMYSFPQQHYAGHYHIQAKDVKALDSTALQPVEPPPKIVLRAWETLGMDKKAWDKASAMAIQESGRYLSMKLVLGRILLTKGMQTLGEVEAALKWSRAILESECKALDVNDKMVAAQMVAVCARSFKEISQNLLEICEKTQEKTGQDRPRNLPPTVALQLNMGNPPAAQPAPTKSASNGSTAETQPDPAK